MALSDFANRLMWNSPLLLLGFGCEGVKKGIKK